MRRATRYRQIDSGTDPVHMVTIIPRGMAGGFTAYIPEEDRNFITKTNGR